MEPKQELSLIAALNQAGKPFIGTLGQDDVEALNAARLHGFSQLAASGSDTYRANKHIEELMLLAGRASIVEGGEFEIDPKWINPDDQERPKRSNGVVVNIRLKNVNTRVSATKRLSQAFSLVRELEEYLDGVVELFFEEDQGSISVVSVELDTPHGLVIDVRYKLLISDDRKQALAQHVERALTDFFGGEAPPFSRCTEHDPDL